jgi:hypothetical protein
MNNIKTELTLNELLSLEIEFCGSADGTQKGILKQEIKNPIKMQIHRLLKRFITPNREIFASMNKEIFEKYSDGESIRQFLPDGSKNPNLEKYNSEIKELLSSKIDIEIPIFKLEDFDFKSGDYTPVFFDLICQCEELEPANT